MGANPGRYTRQVDTLLMDHIVDIICKQDLYKECFSSALKAAFPSGNEEARDFLVRLIPIRNKLSHANPISVHEAERVLCYCDDVIEVLMGFYKEKSLDQEYNAPRFTRFSDSRGHSQIIQETVTTLHFSSDTVFRPGDNVRFEVEVDSSFNIEDYTVEWSFGSVYSGAQVGLHAILTVEEKHVSQRFSVHCTLKSNKQWHRHGLFDDVLTIVYKVLPPIL